MEPIGCRLASGEMVLREVGRGALARVYLVSDGSGVRALKLLPRGQAARADHEHRVARDLCHPHVVRVEARVDLCDRPGVLMPLVLGRPLLARGRTARDRDAYLAAFAQLLSALAYLHERGLVHRDVKPENVLLDRAGRVTLIDFDLAMRRDAPQSAPRVAGTLAYLSPEQARGSPATTASDLYAAGVMLYAALTGEVPFRGTIAQLLVPAGAAAELPPPSSLDPQLAPADELLAGLLAVEPGQRPRHAAAVAEVERLRRAWTDASQASRGAS